MLHSALLLSIVLVRLAHEAKGKPAKFVIICVAHFSKNILLSQKAVSYDCHYHYRRSNDVVRDLQKTR